MKTIKYIYLLPAFFAVIAFPSCAKVDSAKVASSEIYTSYSATYSEDSNRVNVNANFTVGKGFGTQVTLNENSSINVNGVKMRENSDLFGGVYYDYHRTISSSDDLMNPLLIRYQDNEGHIYNNALSIPSRVTASPSIYHGGDFTVNWSTYDRLGVDENISASLSTNGVTIFASDHNGGNNGRIIFRSEDMAGLSGTSATLIVCRKFSTDAVDAPSVGGYINISYCASTIRVSLR